MEIPTEGTKDNGMWSKNSKGIATVCFSVLIPAVLLLSFNRVHVYSCFCVLLHDFLVIAQHMNLFANKEKLGKCLDNTSVTSKDEQARPNSGSREEGRLKMTQMT